MFQRKILHGREISRVTPTHTCDMQYTLVLRLDQRSETTWYEVWLLMNVRSIAAYRRIQKGQVCSLAYELTAT